MSHDHRLQRSTPPSVLTFHPQYWSACSASRTGERVQAHVLGLSASEVVLSDGTTCLRYVSLHSSSGNLFEEVFDPLEETPRSVVVYATADRDAEDAFRRTRPGLEDSRSIDVPDHLPAPVAPRNITDFPHTSKPFIASAARGSHHTPGWVVRLIQRFRGVAPTGARDHSSDPPPFRFRVSDCCAPVYGLASAPSCRSMSAARHHRVPLKDRLATRQSGPGGRESDPTTGDTTPIYSFI
jgi:hypothetical protein